MESFLKKRLKVLLWGMSSGATMPQAAGHKGVIVEGANQGIRRVQAHDVLGHEAVPQNLDGMTLGATSDRAVKGLEERGVVEGFKNGLKLCDDGWRLNSRAGGSNICGDHRGVRPSLVGLEDTDASTSVSSSFVTTIILRNRFIYQPLDRRNTANCRLSLTRHRQPGRNYICNPAPESLNYESNPP